MSTALAENQNSELVTLPTTQLSTPSALLEIAINKNADVEKLDRLMEMQVKWEEREAKKMHTIALTNFQKKCPVITKSKQGHNYKYAPMSDIIVQIKDALAECGLSYRFEQNDGDGITITCIITHVAGHSESTKMKASPDTSGSKNIIQAIGSTVTYLQRYTLLGALGIATADEDMDGRIGNEVDYQELYNNLLQHIACARDSFDEITNIKVAVANEQFDLAKTEWTDLTREVQSILWLAPTKGGILTSDERKVIKEGKL